MGPGIFVEKLIESGISKNQITAFDIDSSFEAEIKQLNISFKEQDTLLSLYPDSYNEFDFIVGNPPYLNKASTYVRMNRGKLSKIYGKINAHETYAMFIVNSIWRLKEGGKLGFITSDSFLTLSTHKKLRKFILNNCKIDEILLAPKSLFSNQNVNTSPVIIILTKCSGHKNKEIRENNIMRMIPRVMKEDEYLSPSQITKMKQIRYNSLPFNIFFTDIYEEVIEIFEQGHRLEEYLKGFIGMHTHNNRKYIAAIEGTELAEVFKNRNMKNIDSSKKFKFIERKDFQTGKWKPYLKRGGADQYYRPIMEALDWREESIKIYDIPKNVPFEHEGIVISGISSRLAARYMPRGCYWDSNKAIGFIVKDKKISINFFLGLLNSSLYNYFAKGIINNTNSIQLTGIHALPFIKPDEKFKSKVEFQVDKIIEKKKQNPNYDYDKEQQVINNLVFDYYAKNFDLTISLKKKIDRFSSIN